jgi:hypothetical protein
MFSDNCCRVWDADESVVCLPITPHFPCLSLGWQHLKGYFAAFLGRLRGGFGGGFNMT